MENRIVKKVDVHVSEFKNQIKEWFNTNESDICGTCTRSDFLKFIFDYDSVLLSKEDFQKRKRVKNTVPIQLRCCARRANGEQCTRRKKDEHECCGTHIKGIPHGQITNNEIDSVENNKKKISVWAEEIMGITYYIDSNHNVYSPGDILSNIENPSIVAKWEKHGDKYTIPSLFKN